MHVRCRGISQERTLVNKICVTSATVFSSVPPTCLQYLVGLHEPLPRPDGLAVNGVRGLPNVRPHLRLVRKPFRKARPAALGAEEVHGLLPREEEQERRELRLGVFRAILPEPQERPLREILSIVV